MQKSSIDKDFVNVVAYLDNMGFKPWSSCDGVLANHKEASYVDKAYMCFMESEKIIDLMAALYRDEDFELALSNNSYAKKRIYAGNVIEGNNFGVYFPNLYGERTDYFHKIIKGIAEGKIEISDEERERIRTIDEAVRDIRGEELFITAYLNSEYDPYMKKTGKTNKIKCHTKEGLDMGRNMKALGDKLASFLGCTNNSYAKRGDFSGDIYLESCRDTCQLLLKGDSNDIANIINYCKSIEKQLPQFEEQQIFEI